VAAEKQEPEISKKLQEAIEQLHRDVQKVEVWAGALTGFSQPVPEYKPPADAHLLPPVDSAESQSKDA